MICGYIYTQVAFHISSFKWYVADHMLKKSSKNSEQLKLKQTVKQRDDFSYELPYKSHTVMDKEKEYL